MKCLGEAKEDSLATNQERPLDSAPKFVVELKPVALNGVTLPDYLSLIICVYLCFNVRITFL